MSTWYDRASIIPGRSNTRSKQPGALYPIGAGPHYAIDANGPYIRGDDGTEYLDMVCGLGAISLGYDRANVIRTWLNADLKGLGSCSLPWVGEVEAAEAVLGQVAPWASSVRFVRTGSEATHGALMVARKATGRRWFWRLNGSYHGWHSGWQEENGQAYWFDVGRIPDFSIPNVDFLHIPLFSTEPAAVIIEPPRWEQFGAEWLQQVVDAAHDAGALVIFDEMVYGGRWALGGATEYYGIQPDLACYGKAFGNGAPVAMIVGNDALAKHGTAISGTYSGDAHAATTLMAVLEEYKRHDVVSHMWTRGKQLQEGLRQAITASGVDAEVEGAPVHQRIAFKDESLGPLFSAEMVKRGVIWAPYATNIMLAHEASDIDRVVNAAGESLESLMGEGE